MIFPVYKPKGISSYDVIRRLKWDYPKGTKIGHGGTLDPLADGVLVLAVGRESTKKLHDVLHNVSKEYVGEITLGKVSETDDSEGPIRDANAKKIPGDSIVCDGSDQSFIPERDDIENTLKSFVGRISQVPPKYSAVKVQGQSAYKRSRKGEDVTLAPKLVTIHEINVVQYTYPILKINVVCGSGVYIRSLARDIGEKLGVGGYLSALTRIRVGEYTLDSLESARETRGSATRKEQIAH